MPAEESRDWHQPEGISLLRKHGVLSWTSYARRRSREGRGYQLLELSHGMCGTWKGEYFAWILTQRN